MNQTRAEELEQDTIALAVDLLDTKVRVKDLESELEKLRSVVDAERQTRRAQFTVLCMAIGRIASGRPLDEDLGRRLQAALLAARVAILEGSEG